MTSGTERTLRKFISTVTVVCFMTVNAVPFPGMPVFETREAAAESVRVPMPDPDSIFADGFESGDAVRWSDALDVDRAEEDPVTDVALSPTRGAATVNQMIVDSARASERAQAQSDFVDDAVIDRAGRQTDDVFNAFDDFSRAVNNQYAQLDQLFAAHNDLYSYINGLDRVSDQNAIDFNRQTDILAQQVDPMIQQSRNMANRATSVDRQLDSLSDSISKARRGRPARPSLNCGNRLMPPAALSANCKPPPNIRE